MNFYLWVAVFILISVVAGLIRILKGPTAADSMLAAQLLGTGGVAILLILAMAMKMSALVDVALVYAVLAAITLAVFVRRQWRDGGEKTGDITDESN